MSHTFRFLPFLLLAPLAAACSHTSSPTAPAAYDSAAAAAGLAASGTSVQLAQSSSGRRPPGPVEGESQVTSLVRSTSCPALSFTIGDDVIKVTASTTYVGGACQDILPGVTLEVRGAVGTDGVITASMVVFRGGGNNGRPNERFVEGNVVVRALVDGTSCPTLSFVAEGHTIKTTAETTYSSGRCVEITAGSALSIRGTIGADEVVTASHIVLKGDHATEVEGEIAVSSLVAGTSCPTLSFVARGHTFKTDSSTRYVGGACSDIAVGVRLQVKGLLLSDETIVATGITFKRGDN